jgi:hypothetical protein
MTGAEFEELLTRLDALVAEFEEHPDPVVSARALEMIQLVDAVHRAGLGRLAELIRRRDPKALEDAAQDGVVSILFALYELELGASAEAGAFVPLAQLEASARAARARLGDRR